MSSYRSWDNVSPRFRGLSLEESDQGVRITSPTTNSEERHGSPEPAQTSKSPGSRRASDFTQIASSRSDDSPIHIQEKTLLIDYGRTQAELKHSHDKITALEKDNQRVRRQRDTYRATILTANLELPTIFPLETSVPSSVASTPQLRPAVLAEPPSFQPGHASTYTTSLRAPHAMPPPRTSITPVISHTAEKKDIGKAFSDIVDRIERWISTFAVTPMAPSYRHNDIMSLVEFAKKLTRDESADSMIYQTSMRRYVLTPVFMHKMLLFFGDMMINTYWNGAHLEFNTLNAQLYNDARRPQGHERHTLLDRKASITSEIIATGAFQHWKRAQISGITVDLTHITRKFVPLNESSRSVVELRGIVESCINTCEYMNSQACEWRVDYAERGQRYEPSCMVYRNPDLLVEEPAPGSVSRAHVQIRFGIAPALTEVSFATGALMTVNRHKKVVFLMLK